MRKLFVVLTCVAMFSGCVEPKKYTVVDHVGITYEHMRAVDGGWGWTEFEGLDGKMLVVRGNYSYTEE